MIMIKNILKNLNTIDNTAKSSTSNKYVELGKKLYSINSEHPPDARDLSEAKSGVVTAGWWIHARDNNKWQFNLFSNRKSGQAYF